MSDLCAVEVSKGDTWHPYSEACGRKAKGALTDGSPACGIHLRAERVRAEADAQRDAGQKHRKRLAARLGLSYIGAPTYSHHNVSVHLSELEALADRLEALS